MLPLGLGGELCSMTLGTVCSLQPGKVMLLLGAEMEIEANTRGNFPGPQWGGLSIELLDPLIYSISIYWNSGNGFVGI